MKSLKQPSPFRPEKSSVRHVASSIKQSETGQFYLVENDIEYNITVALEEITPLLAAEYLDRNYEGNRKRSNVRVRRYANVMKRHRWRVTPDAIAFDDEDYLIEGQHRLESIIQSGETIHMFVMRGFPTEVYQALGRPMIRRIDDVATEEWITARTVAIGRVMLLGVRAGSGIEVAGLDEDALLSGIRSHQKAISFVESLHHNKIVTAPVMGAVARAYYHTSNKRIQEFMEVLQTNEPKNAHEDHAALILRRYITDDANGSNSYKARAELFRRTETALIAFLAKERINGKFLPADREMFSLPKVETPE